MPLNNLLSLRQKYALFANVPAARTGLYIFVLTSILAISIIVRSDESIDKWPLILLVFIFPTIGLALMYPALRALPRMIRALENGVCIEGQLLSTKATSTRIRGRPLIKLKLGYELYGQLHTCEERLVDPSQNIQQHWLMVDAEDPDNAVYVEALPTDLKQAVIRRNQLS